MIGRGWAAETVCFKWDVQSSGRNASSTPRSSRQKNSTARTVRSRYQDRAASMDFVRSRCPDRNRKRGRFRRLAPQLRRSSGKTQAEVVVPVRRRVRVAVRRLAVRAVVVPATAPVHPVRGPGPLTAACCSTLWRNRQLHSPGVRVNAVMAVIRSWNWRSESCPER